MLFLVSWGFRPGNLFSLLKKVHETIHALFLKLHLSADAHSLTEKNDRCQSNLDY